jgi:hypothetical protein
MEFDAEEGNLLQAWGGPEDPVNAKRPCAFGRKANTAFSGMTMIIYGRQATVPTPGCCWSSAAMESS